MQHTGVLDSLPHDTDTLGLDENTFWCNYIEFEAHVLSVATQLAQHARRAHAQWSDILVALELAYRLQLEDLMPQEETARVWLAFRRETVQSAMHQLAARGRAFQDTHESQLRLAATSASSLLPKSTFQATLLPTRESAFADAERHKQRMQFLALPRIDSPIHNGMLDSFRSLMRLTAATMRPFQPRSKAIKDRLLAWQKKLLETATVATTSTGGPEAPGVTEMDATVTVTATATSTSIATQPPPTDLFTLTPAQEATLWHELWQQDSGEAREGWNDLYTARLPIITDPSGSEFGESEGDAFPLPGTPASWKEVVDGTRKRGRKKQTLRHSFDDPVQLTVTEESDDVLNENPIAPRCLLRPVYVHPHMPQQLHMLEARLLLRATKAKIKGKVPKVKAPKERKQQQQQHQHQQQEQGLVSDTSAAAETTTSASDGPLLDSNEPSRTRLCVNEVLLSMRASTQLRSLMFGWRAHSTATSTTTTTTTTTHTAPATMATTTTSVGWPALPLTMSSWSGLDDTFERRWREKQSHPAATDDSSGHRSSSSSSSITSGGSSLRVASRPRVTLFASSASSSATNKTSLVVAPSRHASAASAPASAASAPASVVSAYGMRTRQKTPTTSTTRTTRTTTTTTPPTPMPILASTQPPPIASTIKNPKVISTKRPHLHKLVVGAAPTHAPIIAAPTQNPLLVDVTATNLMRRNVRLFGKHS